MIFQLGKSKANVARKIEEDTLNRWRQMSIEDEENAEGLSGSSDAPKWAIGEDTGGGEYVRVLSGNDTTSAESAINRSAVKPVIETSAENEPVQNNTSPASKPATNQSYTRSTSTQFGPNVKTALGPGTLIDGKFSFDSPVRIDGNLSGEVSSTSALIVGEQATVNADIQVGSLIIFGQVTGDVRARDLVEIRAGGQLDADIKTERLVIETGGVFNGGCNI